MHHLNCLAVMRLKSSPDYNNYCFTVNLAFDKSAVQSVTYTLDAGDFGPDQAVDGDNFTCSRVTSTASDNPSWSVDLGETSYITGLVLIVPVKCKYLEFVFTRVLFSMFLTI